MTGNARFDTVPDGGLENAAAGVGDGAARPRVALVVLAPPPVDVRAGDHARPGPEDMRVLLPVPENAGSRVATAMSRGANALTVAPGRAVEKRRTTGPDGELAAACALRATAFPAAAGAGATVRIVATDAGLTAAGLAVLRSRRALPAARNNAGPRGAGVAVARTSAPGAACASPPIEANAIPPAGWYDERLAGDADVAGVDDDAGSAVAEVAAGRIVRDVVTGDGLAGDSDAAAAGRTAFSVGAGADATGGGELVALAGSRRTTAGPPGGVDDAADRDPAAAAAADGAGSSERRAVAVATVNAGPVTRRSAAGAAATEADGVPGWSRADINGSTAVMPRATVSPGWEWLAGDAATVAAESVAAASVEVLVERMGPAPDAAGAGGRDWVVAIERRTTGLAADTDGPAATLG
ncbi:MAG: hypothetical protein JO079_09005 [Frankiaceae bacterium]|nr:hypothetical protein [Frankiaceae bacterium]MBV9368816.1 hypothetical protein [Frankiales bacterium]